MSHSIHSLILPPSFPFDSFPCHSSGRASAFRRRGGAVAVHQLPSGPVRLRDPRRGHPPAPASAPVPVLASQPGPGGGQRRSRARRAAGFAAPGSGLVPPRGGLGGAPQRGVEFLKYPSLHSIIFQ